MRAETEESEQQKEVRLHLESNSKKVNRAWWGKNKFRDFHQSSSG
jgi:hypothetical protein